MALSAVLDRPGKAARRVVQTLRRKANALRRFRVVAILLPPPHGHRTLVQAIARRLPPDGGTVAVLTSGSPGQLARTLRRAHPAAVIHDIADTDSASHVRLTTLGPFDLIVDDRPKTVRTRRFLDAFYQLRRGGAMIIRDAANELDPATAPTKLGQLLADALASQGTPPPPHKKLMRLATYDVHELGISLRSVTSDGTHLVLVNDAAPVLAKLGEREMNDYLALNPDLPDKVLEVIPAQPFRSRCVLHENSASRSPNFPRSYETIDISLRQYHQVVVTPGQVVSNNRLVLPDSFRHNQYPRLANWFTAEVAPRFARLRHGTEDLPELEGTYFYLDSEYRGHFGHLLTEQVSRFWAWQRALEIAPDVKAVVTLNRGRELREWESDIYAAGGIPREKVVFLREPTRVERLIAGTPLLSNPDYIHPRILQTWRGLGDKLAEGATGRELPKRFFCARRIEKRPCRNAAEVEALFAAEGFEVIYPEDYSLGDQVVMFRNAEMVAGFAGSGLFNLCFAEDPKTVIAICSQAYSARNEYLFASLLGHELYFVTSVPEVADNLQSPFTFDHGREGRYLRRVFESVRRPEA